MTYVVRRGNERESGIGYMVAMVAPLLYMAIAGVPAVLLNKLHFAEPSVDLHSE